MATENNTPYVFISYAHADSGVVLSAIRAMQNGGINLWYDSGIEAGSEWPEYIAEKVMNCNKFVLFVSKAYLASQNCKRELNFAISRKKDILSIFLEDVELSPGMEMQLGTYQAIFRNRFASQSALEASLAEEPFFYNCKQQKEAPAEVSAPQEPEGVSAPQSVNQEIPEPGAYKPVQPTVIVSPDYQQTKTPVTPPSEKKLPYKNKYIAAILAFIFGSFGIHKFYLNKPLLGVLYLIFCWTYIPGYIGIVECIILLVQSKEKFEQKYKCIMK